MPLQKLILNQFDPSSLRAVIEFTKYISELDADILIFMARKSLCLYDVFTSIGLPSSEIIIASDRILDINLDVLKNKNIALIDDTLICGTTLGKTKHKLLNSVSTNVSVTTLCVDVDNWNRALIKPDRNFLEYSHNQMMTFCASEVRAMSLLPRPYLVDFPISDPYKIRIPDSSMFLSSVDWNSIRISSEFQTTNGVHLFSFFPTDIVYSQLNGIDNNILNLSDIIKVRTFSRTIKDIYWTKIVPIVTLKPLSEKGLSDYLEYYLGAVGKSVGHNFYDLLYSMRTPFAKLRLLQYIFSTILGHIFTNSLSNALGHSVVFRSDLIHCERSFGPWNHDCLEKLQLGISQFISSKPAPVQVAELDPIKTYLLPVEVQDNAKNILSKDLSDINLIFEGDHEKESIGNLVALFFEIFIKMHKKLEGPAREKAKNLGSKYYEEEMGDIFNRDRLEIGIPWQCLVDHVSAVLKQKPSHSFANLFSLVLDLCVDYGVAVPVSCIHNKIVYRGYRYGEDVLFSDGELSLSYTAVESFLKTSQRTTIPKLVLEKLIVFLIKIGIAKQFIQPIFGVSGYDGVARIGFHLKGAVPVLSRGSASRSDNEVWLSSYLLERKAIIEVPHKGYGLGEKIEGNYITKNAPEEARDLGAILAYLYRPKELRSPKHASNKDGDNRVGIYEDSDLITLATCWPPRNMAAAISAELSIAGHFFNHSWPRMSQKIIWGKTGTVQPILKELRGSTGYETVQSSRMKIIAYIKGQLREVVLTGVDHLCELFGNDFIARKWKSYFIDLLDNELTDERVYFNQIINEASLIIWELSTYIYMLEIALTLGSHNKKDDAVFKAKLVVSKMVKFNQDFLEMGFKKKAITDKIQDRFEQLIREDIYSVKPEDIYNYAVAKLHGFLPRVLGMAQIIDSTTRDYGKFVNRHKYQYLLWYDIVDSTATKSGKIGKPVDATRETTRRFKMTINQIVNTITILARKNDCEIYCWNGDKFSFNDEKHVFFSGKFARDYMVRLYENIMDAAKCFKDFKVRMYLIPCSFVGTEVYRAEPGTEVNGERFWEHFSRIKKGTEKFEKKHCDDHSFIVVGTDELIKHVNIPEAIKIIASGEPIVETEIALLSRGTRVKWYSVQADTNDSPEIPPLRLAK
ncbi:MAG: hypothetical protein KQJ78_02725 [Deltaproteobacteria bacterium]|nr:hypothetical protein [Deltaproteobacteria bacterium]